jgi:hypothetical protein
VKYHLQIPGDCRQTASGQNCSHCDGEPCGNGLSEDGPNSRHGSGQTTVAIRYVRSLLLYTHANNLQPTAERQESAGNNTRNDRPPNEREASSLACPDIGKGKNFTRREPGPTAYDDIQPILSNSREQSNPSTSGFLRKIKIRGPYILSEEDGRRRQLTREVTALLDTGSEVNLISEEAFSKLTAQGLFYDHEVFEKPREDIRSPSGHRLRVTGQVKIGWMLYEQASHRTYWEDTFLIAPLSGFKGDIIISGETMLERKWCLKDPFEDPPPRDLVVASFHRATDSENKGEYCLCPRPALPLLTV